MALESRSENNRHISVDPQYNNNRPKEKKSADSKRKDKKGDDNDNKRAEPLWHVILLNLIPFLVATGVYFLAYSILPGKGYLYIFYSVFFSIGGLFLLEGVITGTSFERDLNSYVILLVILLAGFMAINYKKPEAMIKPAQDAAPAYAPAPAPAPIPVYGPGLYKITVPAHNSKIFRMKNHCHFNIKSYDTNYSIEIRGIIYNIAEMSQPVNLPSVDRNTDIKIIAHDNAESITMEVIRQ